MEVELRSDITVRLVQSLGGDFMVVAAARVSTTGQEALEFAKPGSETEARGLIRYLMKQRHGTPFEHAAMTFFVHAPIFVFREWHRHRIGHSYNEESARYKPLAPVFWIPRRDRAMMPVDGWKPGRPKFMTLEQKVKHEREKTPSDLTEQAEADMMYVAEIQRNRAVYELAYSKYTESILAGFAMEVARCKLPVGIYSSCWVTVNPRSLMAFLSLRTHDEKANHVSYPQAEIEEAARACEQVFKEGWPMTYAAWEEFGREAP